MASNSDEFFKLYKGCTLIGSQVLRNYINVKIAPNYESFLRFVNEKKHDIYHKCLDCKKCCFCVFCESTKTTSKNTDKRVFDAIYKEIKDRKVVCVNHQRYEQSSERNNNKELPKVSCICRFIPISDLTIDDVDITTLCMLIAIENMTNEDVQCIKELRNKLSHHASPEMNLEYEKMWKSLSSSVTSLAMSINVYYKEAVEAHLSDIKAQVINEEEKTKYFEDLKKYFQQQEEMKAGLDDLKSKMKRLVEFIVEREHLRAKCKCHNISEGEADEMELVAEIGNLPPSWNTSTISENLNQLAENGDLKNDDFQICDSMAKCIILHLKASVKVFENQHNLETAFRKLLDRIVHAGDIDTLVPETISINIRSENKDLYEADSPEHSNTEDIEHEEFYYSPPKFSLDEIGFLTYVVLDIFPKILREWIFNYINETRFWECHKQLSPSVQSTEILEILNELDLEQLFEYYQLFTLPKEDLVSEHSMDENNMLGDINRMLSMKKRVFHRSSAFVDDKEMNLHFTDICEIVARFDKILLKKKTETFTFEMQCMLAYCFNLVEYDLEKEDEDSEDGEIGDIACSVAKKKTKLTIDRRPVSTISSTDSGLGSEKISRDKRHKQKKQIAITDTLTRTNFFKPIQESSTSYRLKAVKDASYVQHELTRAIETEDNGNEYISEENYVTHV